MEVVIDGGADDVIINDDNSIDILTPSSELNRIKDLLIDSGLTPLLAEVTMRAENRLELSRSDAESLIKLIDLLDELDDVQDVYSNANIPDSLLDADIS